MLCTDGPVTSLVELSLSPLFRRGHGALYDALADGGIDEDRLRDLLAAQLPTDAPLMFGVDATTFPRPNAECSPDRGLHYAPCHCDGDRKVVPGWEFQWVTGLEWGSSSWTLPVDARRLPEGACPVTTTATQIRDLAERLAEQKDPGQRPRPLFVLDQGYAAAALTHALEGIDVQLLVRIAGDRVFYDGRPGPRKPGPGRNGVHGRRFNLAADADTRPPDQVLVVPDTTKYGRVEVRAWHGMHQKVQRTGYFALLEGELFSRLPIIEGTVIQVRVERLPNGRSPHRTMWLWYSGLPEPDLDVCWRAYLRRFDMEHTFKMMKSQLGWTAARVRHPEQAVRWTWLLLAAYVQLRLARHLVGDLRRPWERRPRPGRPLTPYRVRRAFRHVHDRLGTSARLPKSTHPGPGALPEGRIGQLPATVLDPNFAKRTVSRRRETRRRVKSQAWNCSPRARTTTRRARSDR
ncbi:hypothetical protein Aple_008280 [Acrocarpospora pleiomorpha]|uniref:Transposase IS701-like DDE domain-containing protein n=1 Tax=Acrocarpospora pleiomorpha TaxID=90975 RepID=A0A5M3XG35_9ACTN|nr:NF041680 family putative transposase [Acrocarpospora pleiomorpha]GES17933.1 hypothetical protein Aple_008280 [Acrocarpospora pleiomorpha]